MKDQIYLFQDNLCKIRYRIGLNQREFAELIGVNKHTVSKWENGDKRMSLKRMNQIKEL